MDQEIYLLDTNLLTINKLSPNHLLESIAVLACLFPNILRKMLYICPILWCHIAILFTLVWNSSSREPNILTKFIIKWQ